MAENLLTVTVKACVDDVKGLIKQLKSLQTYKLFVGDDMTLVDINDVIEIFTNHIKAERMTGDDTVQWIPCSERMPEDYTEVLAWFEYFRYGSYNRLYQTCGIGCYSSEYDSWMINNETGWRDLKVYAWMPLPEPWKGEKV